MNKNKYGIMTAVKGLVVGATMLVPGVSGGSMAMILGLYDRLIQSVSSFFKDKKGNLLFLGEFSAAAVLGMIIFARPLEALLSVNEKMMMFFFVGVVLGGCPVICRAAGVEKFGCKEVLCLFAGAAAVTTLGLLPKNLFASAPGGTGETAVQFIAGIVISVALILPGISVTYMLLLLGMYQKVLAAIGTLDFACLLPIAAGAAAGIFLLTRGLEWVMKRFPKTTYLVILGFVLGSVSKVFPGMPRGIEIPGALAAGILGFWAIGGLGKLEERLHQDPKMSQKTQKYEKMKKNEKSIDI